MNRKEEQTVARTTSVGAETTTTTTSSSPLPSLPSTMTTTTNQSKHSKSSINDTSRNETESKGRMQRQSIIETIRQCYCLRRQFTNIRLGFVKFLCKFTGHDDLPLITSFDKLVEFMYRPVDAASIGIGRLLFGE